MSGTIQTIPQGLLGLLQLKQTGNNPGQLADVVTPCVDLTQFWLQRNIQTEIALFGAAQTVAVNAAGQSGPATMVVPSNQCWYVYQYDIHCNLLAAEYIRAKAEIGTLGVSTMSVGPDVNDVVTARARTWTCRADAPFWAQPQTNFLAGIMDIITAGNITLTFQLRAVPIPI